METKLRQRQEAMDVVKKLKNLFSYWYQRYLLATELYMVEPWERLVIHIFFLILFVLFWQFNYKIVVHSVAQLRMNNTPYAEQIKQ